MTVFAKVFARGLDGKYERELMVNLDHIVKIEPTNKDDTDPRSAPLSIVTLDSGEELVVLAQRQPPFPAGLSPQEQAVRSRQNHGIQSE